MSAAETPDPGLLAGQRALREATALTRTGYVLVPVHIHRAADGKKDAHFPVPWKSGGSSDPAVLRDWSVQFPGCSFAILCGPSGIEVVDLDGSAADAGPAWWAAQGLPSSSVVVDTPSGGQHHYYRRPAMAQLVNNAGKVGPGVDARTVGGLVFAPGSYVRGEEDRPYTARVPVPAPALLQETPAAVLDLWGRSRATQATGARRAPAADRLYTSDEATRYVETEAGAPLRSAVYGENVNDALNKAAVVCGHFVPEFWDEDTARDYLVRVLLDGPGARNGWTAPDREDLGTIRSGLRRGQEEPYGRRVAPGSNHLADAAPAPLGNTPAPHGPVAVDVAPVPLAPAVQVSTDEALAVLVERVRLQRAARRIVDAEERPPDPGPVGRRLAAFLAEPDEGQAWRVDGLWPQGGKVLLAAPAKAGKTTTVMNLVRALVDAGTGARFLDKPVTPVAPGGPVALGNTPAAGPEWKVAAAGFGVAPLAPGRRAALLDFEMTPRGLRRWLRGMGIGNLDGLVIELMRGRAWDVRDPAVRGQWAAWLRSEAVQVLIVDPVGPVLHGLGIDENDNSAVGAVLVALDALCRDAGVDELLVVHHAGHGGDEGQERARGASAFLGWPDALWTLGRDKITNTRGFRADGRDVFQPDRVLVHDPDTHRLWLGDESRAQARHSGDVEPVADIVSQECADRAPGSEGPSLNEVTRALMAAEGWGKPRAQEAIHTAVRLGAVHVHRGHNRAQHHHPGGSCESCTPASGDPG